MKKSHGFGEITRLNGASLKIRPRTVGGQPETLEELLDRVLGGDSETLSGCTEFSCTLYIPPPPQV